MDAGTAPTRRPGGRLATVSLAIAATTAVVLGSCSPASPSVSTAPSIPVSLPSVGASVAPSPTASSEPAEPLAEALQFITLETVELTFTDWTALKAAAGVADLTSADPYDERLAFLRSLAAVDTPDSPWAGIGLRGYTADALRTHWGFDDLDLAWEAEIVLRGVHGGRVVVLRFPDTFDLAPLAARFDERGFVTEQRDGVTIRTHEQTPDEWLRNSDPAFLNAAFLADGQTVVLSLSAEALDAALSQADPLPALRSAPVLLDTAAALEQPTSAFLAFDLTQLCNPTLRLPSSAELVATVESLLEEAGTLHPYTVMAVGNRGSLTPPGRIVFGYGDPAEAAADLAGRRLLATEGVSVLRASGRRLDQTIFTVVDAQVSGGSLILLAGPPVMTQPLPSGVTGLSPAYFLTFLRIDAVFAACDLGA